MRWVGFSFVVLGSMWVIHSFTAPKATAQVKSLNSSVDSCCSLLSQDEQQFAFGLILENREIFCCTFTPVQRAAAMQLTSQPDPTGALLSPDDAVQKVVESIKISPNSQAAGFCPNH